MINKQLFVKDDKNCIFCMFFKANCNSISDNKAENCSYYKEVKNRDEEQRHQ